MLKALITSKTRIKLLLKFFLNSSNRGYLRSLEPDFGESTNAIRQELNRFEKAGLLLSDSVGDKIDKNYLLELVEKVEKLLERKIRCIIISLGEIDAFLQSKPQSELLLVWKKE